MKAACRALMTAALVGWAVPAHAGSVSQPGQTLGLAVGAPVPDGLYFIDTFNFGRRTGRTGSTDVGLNIPALLWATPARPLGAHLGLLVSLPNIWVTGSSGRTQSGLTNPWFGAIFAWNVGGGLGVSFLPSIYIPSGTNLDTQSTTFNQRFGISYTADGYNLTANLYHGVVAGPLSNGGVFYPDFLNLDLTATKRFGNWELGPVAFASTDLPTNFVGYRSQRQAAVGGLVGYDFGRFTLQAYVTRDVAQQNYGGRDTRGWLRVVAPLYTDTPATGPAPLRARH